MKKSQYLYKGLKLIKKINTKTTLELRKKTNKLS